MKKVLLAMSAAAFMVACNSNPSANIDAAAKATTADTAGLAAFNAAKAQQALVAAEIAAAPIAVATYQKAAAPEVRTVTRYVPVRQAATKRSSASRSTARSSSASSAPIAASKPEVLASESSNAAKKKGISKAAKGAIIGGVTGAVTGAIVNKKNRAVGAVIGGVAGAAGGAVIGRGMDKKDGRYLTPGFNANSGINSNTGFNGGY